MNGADDPLRRFWHPVAPRDEVRDRPVAARLLGEPLVLWRSGGRVAAFREQVRALGDYCTDGFSPRS